jgi:hypothetical protein
MNDFNPSEEARCLMKILSFHAEGRRNAITREEARTRLNAVLRSIGVSPVGDRKMRDIYAELPVCSCDEGIFVPTREADLAEFRGYLAARVKALAERWKRVTEAHPELATGGVQMELDIERGLE